MGLGELNDIIGEEMRKRHWRPMAAQKAHQAQLLAQQQQQQRASLPRLIIGHCDYDTKRLGFVLEHFKKQGHQVIPFDLSKPIEEQGRFDVLIQKATKLIAKRSEDAEARRKIELLEQYKKSNPACVITDTAQAVEFTTDRVLLDRALETLHVTDGIGKVFYPRSVILDMNPEFIAERESLLKEFNFPAVAKPMNADGSPESHDMALVYNAKGLTDLKLGDKIVLQEFVNHDAVLHKVYVIGDKVFMGVRPSLPNIDLEAKILDYEYFGRISSAEDDACKATSAPSQLLVEKACRELRNRLGLSLFGVDIITKTGTDEHFVIDVNYFPTYAGVPNVAESFSDFIETAIIEAKKAARAG